MAAGHRLLSPAEQSALPVRTQFTTRQRPTAPSLCAHNQHCYLPARASPRSSLLRFHQIERPPGRPAGTKWSSDTSISAHKRTTQKGWSGDSTYQLGKSGHLQPFEELILSIPVIFKNKTQEDKVNSRLIPSFCKSQVMGLSPAVLRYPLLHQGGISEC